MLVTLNKRRELFAFSAIAFIFTVLLFWLQSCSVIIHHANVVINQNGARNHRVHLQKYAYASILSDDHEFDEAKQMQLSIKPLSSMTSSEQKRRFSQCVRFPELQCARVIEGEPTYLARAQQWAEEKSYIGYESLTIEGVASLVRGPNGCEKLQKVLDLPTSPLTVEERDLPLAFVFLLHSDFGQFLRFFSNIYWPQNRYCFHVDATSNLSFRLAVEGLGKCYPNIITVPDPLPVMWGHPNILNAAHRCLALLNEFNDWRYLMFLSGHDFPIRTNGEMVEVLKMFNGSNDVELTTADVTRYNAHHVSTFDAETAASLSPNEYTEVLNKSSFLYFRKWRQAKPAPPRDVTIYKGSFAATLSREFVKFAVQSKIAQDLLRFFNDTYMPEEQFWSTLNHNLFLNAPGGYPGSCLPHFLNEKMQKAYISRYQVWWGEVCHGIFISGSCLFGVGDLKALVRQPHLIAHKFRSYYQPATLACLEEHFCNRTYFHESGTPTTRIVNTSFYENLPAVQFHNNLDKDNYVCKTQLSIL